MDYNTIEIQQQVRERAVKLQEEFKNIKSFEQDMKRKEQEMLKDALVDREVVSN